MKYVDEYRSAEAIRRTADAIISVTKSPWQIMEICGGQTHSIVKHGLDQLLPKSLSLVHGPGCPVCVTPISKIDAAIALAERADVILCSFGDMLRVPGTERDLLSARADGADVRVVYSPLGVLAIAEENPAKQVVFFSVGFETTAPLTAMLIRQSDILKLRNVSAIVAHVCVPPAMHAILGAPGNTIQGFLAAGHVCTIMGFHEYEPIAAKYRVPIVVTGFEPLDILQGVYLCVRQLEEGRSEVENQYTRSVVRWGNPGAQEALQEVFRPTAMSWRGLGEIAGGGLGFAPRYQSFDAEVRFDIARGRAEPPSKCRAGDVLTGKIKPAECPYFATECQPKRPLGAPMVSSEGACAAYYNYRMH